MKVSKNIIINQLPVESLTKIGHSFYKLRKIQNIDYHGATLLMAKVEIKNVTSFSHNLGFGCAINVKFLPIWIFFHVEIFKVFITLHL